MIKILLLYFIGVFGVSLECLRFAKKKAKSLECLRFVFVFFFPLRSNESHGSINPFNCAERLNPLQG